MAETQNQVGKVAFELAMRITDERMELVDTIIQKNQALNVTIAQAVQARLPDNLRSLRNSKGREASSGFLSGVMLCCWVLALYHVGIEDSLKED